ncbi:MAG: metal-dependent transcriptional regulator [Bacteroidia bacterium]|nr:metal-dependent transcriptional regulator [Bacteroidia bacterium]
MRTETIENYLKTIYRLSELNKAVVSNQQLAERLNVKPATVTEALKHLNRLNYVHYEKSYGTRLTAAGSKLALGIVRRHRIWETYLVQKLGFGWDEVHEIAEELEHIQNSKLMARLAELLGNPVYDPHGEPIPDEKGKIKQSNFTRLNEMPQRSNCKVMGVADDSPVFLRYLQEQGLIIGAEMIVLKLESFDASMTVMCKKKQVHLSAKVAGNILVEMI